MKISDCQECWYLRNSIKCCSYLRGAPIDKIDCPRNGPLIVEKNSGYVIICTDEIAHEGGFLFWKIGGRGYTSDVDQAGVWEDEPKSVRDVVIPLNILLAHFKTKKIVVGNFLELQELMNGKKTFVG